MLNIDRGHIKSHQCIDSGLYFVIIVAACLESGFTFFAVSPLKEILRLEQSMIQMRIRQSNEGLPSMLGIDYFFPLHPQGILLSVSQSHLA